MAKHRLPNRRHGVSLIEALIALAVMAFGMLSLVGVQATMRLNSDLSKQRTEATRIATEELEGLRLFTTVPIASGQQSWDEIDNRTLAAYAPPDSIGNTSYRVERSVNLTTPTQKVVSVKVLWADRTGGAQSVTVDTVLLAAAPALSGLLAVPAQLSTFNSPGGRDPAIPPEAVELDGSRSGSSAFKPFDRGTVVWVFNDYTGVISSRCINVTATQAAIVVGDLANCVTVNGRLVAGLLKFDLTAAPNAALPAGPQTLPLPDLAPLFFSTAVNQSSAAECFANSPRDFATASRAPFAYTYNCLVFLNDNTGWGGKLDVAAFSTVYAGGSDATLAPLLPTSYKVCRYTPATSDYATYLDHPQTYCLATPPPDPVTAAYTACLATRVRTNLITQNFLVIGSSAACPVDSVSPYQFNTRQHQPSP